MPYDESIFYVFLENLAEKYKSGEYKSIIIEYLEIWALLSLAIEENNEKECKRSAKSLFQALQRIMDSDAKQNDKAEVLSATLEIIDYLPSKDNFRLFYVFLFSFLEKIYQDSRYDELASRIVGKIKNKIKCTFAVWGGVEGYIYLNKLLSLNPADYEAMCLKGKIFCKWDMYERAVLECFAPCFKANDKNAENFAINIIDTICKVLYMRGKHNKIRKFFDICSGVNKNIKNMFKYFQWYKEVLSGESPCKTSMIKKSSKAVDGQENRMPNSSFFGVAPTTNDKKTGCGTSNKFVLKQ